MGQVLIRNLDDGVIQRLKWRARFNGRSLEAELRDILTANAKPTRAQYEATAAAIRSKIGKVDVEIAALIREGRDSR